MMKSDTKPLESFWSSFAVNFHWAVGMLVLFYVVLSEYVGFYLLGAPTPGQDRVAWRSIECMILWGLVYTIIIMCSAALGKPIMNRRAVARGTLAPVLFGFAVVGWVWWRNGFAIGQAGTGGALRTYLRLIPAFPVAAALVIAALIWLEATIARKLWERNGMSEFEA